MFCICGLFVCVNGLDWIELIEMGIFISISKKRSKPNQTRIRVLIALTIINVSNSQHTKNDRYTADLMKVRNEFDDTYPTRVIETIENTMRALFDSHKRGFFAAALADVDAIVVIVVVVVHSVCVFFSGCRHIYFVSSYAPIDDYFV